MTSIGHIARLKKEINYQADLPRCGNCKYIVFKIVANNDKKRRFCARHNFTCGSNAICDDWKDSA